MPHYKRQYKYGDPLKGGTFHGNARRVTDKGYVKVSYNGNKTVYEHRQVMEDHIGRSLVKGENVHHKNR